MKKYLLSIFTLCLAATMVAQEAEQNFNDLFIKLWRLEEVYLLVI